MSAKKAVETHHARLIEALRQNILDGSWPPGFQLPKETDLALSQGVSRMTMNKVLTQLSSEGFLVRRKRSGTFVAQPRAQSAVMEINDIAEEVAELGYAYAWQLARCERMRLDQLDQTDRVALGITDPRDGAEVLFLHGLHLARGEPFCLETRVIDPGVVPTALDQDFAVTIPGQWLLKTIPFSAARHRVRAVNAEGQDARQLNLPPGTACLEVLRQTRMDQAWVTHVRLLYPGELHQLVAEFTH